MSTKYAEVNTLNEYITCIEKNRLNGFISRGENKQHDCITASAFRYQVPVDFQDMIMDFYNTIGNNITNMQRDNFIAFSQHHGIPTNLIDFSTSPLVSLFFACYEPNGNYEDSGYVYFIDNKKLIDINEMMQFSTYPNNLLKNILEFNSTIYPIIVKLYTYAHTHLHEIEKIIIDWSNKLANDPVTKKKFRRLFPIINKFIESSNRNGIDMYDALSEYSSIILQALVAANDNEYLTDFFLCDKYIEDYRILTRGINSDMQYRYCSDILLVLILIRTVIGELYDFSFSKKLKSIDLPFYFTYTPPNILPRIANQSSLFIYQLHYDDSLADPYIDKIEDRLIQTILPDFVIKVNNKNEMIKALDTMGINLKFIYNDYDNIAKYIKTKNSHL